MRQNTSRHSVSHYAPSETFEGRLMQMNPKVRFIGTPPWLNSAYSIPTSRVPMTTSRLIAPLSPGPVVRPAASAPASSGGGGGWSGGGGSWGGGDGGAAARAAAAAAAAEATRQAQVRAQARQAWEGVISGGRVATNTLENTYNDKVSPFLVDLETGVQNTNKGRANNALNLRRTGSSIAGNVRQGLRSGGVNLAGLNATDSGAAEALARAWSRVGNQQTGSARNQAALKNQELDTSAQTLERKRNDTITSLNQFRNVEVDRIANDIYSKLQQINMDTQAQNVAPTVNAMADKETIVGDALRRVGLIDRLRDARIKAARFLDPREVESEAIRMDAAGAAATPFEVAAPEIDAPDGEGGAELSQIPWIVRRRDQAANTALAPPALGV